MSIDKPNFKANSSEPTANNTAPKKLNRKEVAAVWYKESAAAGKYLNIKIVLPDGKDLWLKAFKNKFKVEGDTKPEYVAWAKEE